MSVEREIGETSLLKFDFLYTIVHTCCILHDILLTSKDRTLDEILVECQLPPENRDINPLGEATKFFEPPRTIALVSEYVESRMGCEDLLESDNLVKIQNN